MFVYIAICHIKLANPTCLFTKLCICVFALYVVKANFGPWKLGPQHGFARISPWVVDKPATKVCILCFIYLVLRYWDYYAMCGYVKLKV